MDKSDKEDIALLIRIFLGLILIGINNRIGNSNPPFSITATPILIPLICLGINYGLIKRSFRLFVIIGFAFLLINDLLIRFYAGGTHDSEGNGFISLSFLISYLIISIGFWIYYLTISKEKRGNNWITILISMVFVLVEYSVIQSRLGM